MPGIYLIAEIIVFADCVMSSFLAIGSVSDNKRIKTEALSGRISNRNVSNRLVIKI